MPGFVVGGGKVDTEGFLKFLLLMVRQGYATGLNLTQRAAGANMSVDANVNASGYAGGLLNTSANVPYFGYIAATENISVNASDPTNPRIDTVVAYVDLSVISSAITNNTGAFKFKAVAGTPAGSPTAPSGGTIQASIGAGYPYITLGNLAVAAAVSSVVNANITDTRVPMAYAVPYLFGGSSNTIGHLVPNVADSILAVLGAAQTWSGIQTFGAGKLITDTPTIRNWDGWEDANESWVFASTTTITVPSDATLKYGVGDKIRFTQHSLVKYFYVVGVAATVLTVSPGQDSTGAAAAVENTGSFPITVPFYSKASSPLGFPHWISYTPTYTGFSANPTGGVLRFKIDGRTVTINIGTNTGTSNTTAYTMLLPVPAATISGGVWRSWGKGVDNGTVFSSALAELVSAGTSVFFYKDSGGTLWTGSGVKVYSGFVTYEI